jgi:Fe-S-cluster containining protein
MVNFAESQKSDQTKGQIMNKNPKPNEKTEKTEFTHPVNLRFECIKCGLCCGDTEKKTRHILLLKGETEKIALQTGQPGTVFSVEAEGKHPYVYEMKKSSEGKCVFLKDNRCSIYPKRPLICIFYPFELKFEEDKNAHAFDFTLECPGINQGILLEKDDFKKLFETAQERLTQKHPR